jgi:hypothetical protein
VTAKQVKKAKTSDFMASEIGLELRISEVVAALPARAETTSSRAAAP